MKKLVVLVFMSAAMLLSSIEFLYAKAIDVDSIYARLQNEMTIDIPVHNLEDNRFELVRSFVKELKELDDLGLGSHALLDIKVASERKNLHQLKLNQLSDKFKKVTQVYHAAAKQVLLNNVKLVRSDDVSKQNKGELFNLFIKTKYNHRTGKPISGILNYKSDISTSLFGEEIVDAGLLVNFPELKSEKWISDALKMEGELFVLFRMHREYQDGVKYEKLTKRIAISEKPSSRKREVKALMKDVDIQNLVATEQVLSDIPVSALKETPIQERVSIVHGFVRSLKKLTVEQDIGMLKGELTLIVEVYKKQVKPVLLDNVKLYRDDDAARHNSGEIMSLFFIHRRNHHTGKPISGMLRYEQDTSSFFGEKKMEAAGLLVEHPELEKEKFIQDALTMESELTVLAEQHRLYLDQGTSVF